MLIFVLRYTPAFMHANFFAEDGVAFTEAVLNKDPIGTLFTGFNGYLIVSLYGMAELAFAIMTILGMHFSQLPIIIATLTCLFLGITVALPFILFRKEMGAAMSLIAVVWGAFVAMPGSDYAIIGTISNLKFAFLYWAFMFVLYRVLHYRDIGKTIICDLVLAVCVLTYIPTVALLPFALWPYRQRISKAIMAHKINHLYTPELISLAVLAGISAVYLLTIAVNGIPKLPGYLDGPYEKAATLKIAFHATWYAWLYPIVGLMKDVTVAGLLGLIAYLGFRNRKNWFVFILAMWTIAAATISFVANRTGVSSYYTTYTTGFDQFFYAQMLVFIFVCLWIIKDAYQNLCIRDRIAVSLCFGLVLLTGLKYTGSFGGNRVIYQNVGTARENISKSCAVNNNSPYITIPLYPSVDWQWKIDRNIACR